MFGLAHVVIGLQVHMRGRMWTYFLYPPEPAHSFPLRLDRFGWANHLGLIAGLLLILLLVLSNDWLLTRLGARRWKALQRWNYGVFGLAVVHGVVYQIIEKRVVGWVITFAVLSALVILLQAAGFWRRRRREWSSSAQSNQK